MDASEWETMKKNEKLLEKALAREKELSSKVETLQQEKIDALKANEKNVTIVKKVQVAESLMCEVPVHNIIQRLSGIVANVVNHDEERRGMRSSHISSNDVQRAMMIRSSSMGYFENEIKMIQDMFFKQRHELRMEDNQESITHKGLDQVKADIAKEYEESMSEEHKQMIHSFGDMRKEIAYRKDNEKKLSKEIKLQGKIIRDLEGDIKGLMKQYDLQKACTVPEYFVSSTRKILSDTRGFVTNGNRLKELDELWRKQD